MPRKKKPNLDPAYNRPIAFTPTELALMENLAVVGMPAYQIGWAMGINQHTWKERCAEDRKLYLKGEKGPDNVWACIQRGKGRGDGALLKTAFEMATVDKNHNVLIHLLKTRLKHIETIKVEGKQTVVYETQIGDDGVIRSTEHSEGDDDEGEAWMQ